VRSETSNTLSAQESVQSSNKRQTRITSIIPEKIENEQLNSQMNRHKAQMKQQQDTIDKERDQLDAHKKELKTMLQDVIARRRNVQNREIEVSEKITTLIAGEEVYGLARSALLSKTWHENTPNAAKNLF